MAILS